jgi:hypothetical protein
MTPGPFERYVREAADGDGADGFLQCMQLMVYPDQPKEWRAVDRAPNRVAEERALDLMERSHAPANEMTRSPCSQPALARCELRTSRRPAPHPTRSSPEWPC